MKTKLTYWIPSLGLAAGFLSFLFLAALMLAFATRAHAKPLPCVESLEHCSTLLADASLHNVDDPSMPGLALAQADGLAPTPVTTSTPSPIPTDLNGFVSDGSAVAKAFASKDYLYAVGLLLFVLIGAYEKFFTNAVPAKDRIFVTLLLPAVIAFAGALVVHATLLVAGEAAGSAIGAAFMAEGGLALLPALKAALGIGAAAAKPAGS